MTSLLAPSRSRIAAAVVAVLVVAAIAATTLRLLDRGPGADNIAFAAAASTEEVLGAGAQTAEKLFTIRPDQVAATRQHASTILDGDAVSQYADLYGPYLERAEGDGLTLQTTFLSIGVVRLEEEDAELLVFADQTAASRSSQGASGAAQFILSMHRTDDTWKVSGIRLL